ncbi:MAG: hypothetical protein LBV12_10045 [Puniceicoccales bacterium]|jgi:hypothetical protein|nr:hypothetical protein [Puniceicoccales bacterium]
MDSPTTPKTLRAALAEILVELRAIRTLLEAKQQPQDRSNEVYNLAEATKYCYFNSSTTFSAWMKKLGRRPKYKGRYPRQLLDECLAQEGRRVPKR